jgi:transcriptional regulator with XRE-family HTH domain
VATARQLAHAQRVATRIHRAMGEEIRRLREDAGLSRRRLAEASGVDPTYLRRVEDGLARATTETYAKVSVALGADLSTRLYPNTGPSIRDRHQARILEALLELLHPRWRPFLEVAVRRPARGWIDAVLHEPAQSLVVATEIQSDLRRIEQRLRWFGEKVASLPSWDGYDGLGDVAPPSQLLVVRATVATRRVGKEFGRQLATAYPAHPADAVASLIGTAPWPGAALVWADLEAHGARFLARR